MGYNRRRWLAWRAKCDHSTQVAAAKTTDVRRALFFILEASKREVPTEKSGSVTHSRRKLALGRQSEKCSKDFAGTMPPVWLLDCYSKSEANVCLLGK